MKQYVIQLAAAALLCIVPHLNAHAWSEHPLIAYPALSGIADLTRRRPVKAVSLRSFLEKEQYGIAELLRKHEIWAREHLAHYAPLPEALYFNPSDTSTDIVTRFLHAIRLNPNAKLKLYRHLLPNRQAGIYTVLRPEAVTTLTDVSSMRQTTYLLLSENELVSPLDVLCSANDEPDYGLDLGLFTDNGTPYGMLYGFGAQPFGDPKLEYGSQAPFHMGFYHENRLIYLFGPFLKKTYPEYRIHLFKALSEYAFATGNQYWGWRFMGWGMHYLGDLSMPYHAKPLPGISTLRMIWINLKAIIGFPKSKNDAVQLVSNRHAALEQFLWLEIRKEYTDSLSPTPIIDALKSPVTPIGYTDSFPRETVALEASQRAKETDRTVEECFPEKLVCNPQFEAVGAIEMDSLIELMRKEKGEESIARTINLLKGIMQSYSMHLQSYYKAIIKGSPKG